MKSNLKWICFFAVICVLCALFWMYQSNISYDHKYVQIRQNGSVIKEIDLDSVTEPYSFDIECSEGKNTVLIEPDGVAVIDADCADKVCVNTGKITDGLTPIVCLPHRLSISVKEKGGDLNAAAG